MKKTCCFFIAFIAGSLCAVAQRITIPSYPVIYYHIVYPEYTSVNEAYSYFPTVEMIEGASEYWGFNEQVFAKKYLAMEALMVSDYDPGFKVDVKLYRFRGMEQPEIKYGGINGYYYEYVASTPIKYQIRDSKGNIIYIANLDEAKTRFTYKTNGYGTKEALMASQPLEEINVAFKEHQVSLLNKMRADIQDHIDFVSYSGKIFYHMGNKTKFPDFAAVQKELDEDIASYVFKPSDYKSTIKGASLKALQFWEKKYETADPADKEQKNIRFLTAYNLGILYTYHSGLDSAEYWLNLAKKENYDNQRLKIIYDWLDFQRFNMKRYQSKPQYYDVVPSRQVGKYHTMEENINQLAKYDLKPKVGEAIVESPASIALNGFIVKNGKRTEGQFIPMPGRQFDMSNVRFQAIGEPSLKLITPFFADSLLIGNDKYLAMPRHFAKLIFENECIKVLNFIPGSGALDARGYIASSTFYVVKKKSKETVTYTVGFSWNKFVEKNFGECAEIITKNEAKVYEPLHYIDRFLLLSADYTQYCK